MPLFEDALEGGVGLGPGLLVAAGAALLAPLAGPVVRPVAKSVVKAGVLTYDTHRENFLRLAEAAADLVAEARAELAERGS